MADIYDMLDTWNASGTTFTAIKMNVTDTASAAGSLLMDLQVGGVSKFSVGKGSGAIFATNLIEQRNGVNAQAFNLYNTYTDASNYERGFMRFVSNVLQIGSEKLGTGTARALAFQTDGVTRMTVEATGAVTATGSLIAGTASGVLSSGYLASWVAGRIGFSVSASLAPGSTLDTYVSRSAAGILAITDAAELTEMVAPAAPSANKVRIYAEDDGAGKTRLMARFATGAAQQIAIEP